MKAFIIFRDRAAYAQLCVSALLSAGLEPVVIDQGSSWVAALSWLGSLERDGIMVLRHGGGHPRSIWDWQPFRDACGDQRYVVTDCDVVPSDCCPGNWPDRLLHLFDKYPEAIKAGLGLRTDNLPAHYSRKDQVIGWEAQFLTGPAEDGVYRAGIDTTLALYRSLAEYGGHNIDNSLRTGWPYVADHLPWHEDLDRLTPELQWYYEHAEPGITHWAPAGRSNWDDR